MATQYQIEQLAGIDSKEIAEYIMQLKTQASINAMELLKMQVSFYDNAGMVFLKEAVKECKKELAEGKEG